MRKLVSAVILGVLALTSNALEAGAATLVRNGDGDVTGATGLLIDGALYDVDFVNQRCRDLFAGCRGEGPFPFTTEAAAIEAGQAIRDQVFRNETGALQMTIDEFAPCIGGCYVLVPYALVPSGTQFLSVIVGLFDNPHRTIGPVAIGYGLPITYAPVGRYPYAVFSAPYPVPQIPVPASGLMLATAAGALGAARRFRPAA